MRSLLDRLNWLPVIAAVLAAAALIGVFTGWFSDAEALVTALVSLVAAVLART